VQTLSELQVGPKAGINDGQRLAISLSATSPLSPSWFSCFDPPAFPPQATPSMAVASVSHTGHTLSNARISWLLHGAATAASIQPFSGRALSESLGKGGDGRLVPKWAATQATFLAHVRRQSGHQLQPMCVEMGHMVALGTQFKAVFLTSKQRMSPNIKEQPSRYGFDPVRGHGSVVTVFREH